jgi:poly(3-hydroxybutyrate) depolymerase
VLLAATATPQTLPTGPQVATFFSHIDDTDQPYALYLPRHFDPARRYPLVISLHDANSNHRLNLRRVFGSGNLLTQTDLEASRRFPVWKDVEYIVASPLARGTMGYQGIPERDVYDVLDDVERRFLIDKDRVYLTGIGTGGGGALWLGVTRPDVWAAIAAVCPSPPPGAMELAGNLLDVPVHLFHGETDPAVNVSISRDWSATLSGLGSKIAYTEYPGLRHNSWYAAYKDGAIFDWFAQTQRNRHPDRVRYATTRYKYNSSYWVRIDHLTPGDLATIDARFSGPNRIEVTTKGLSAFTLRPAGHPRFSIHRSVHVRIDGKPVVVRGGKSLSFERRNGAWIGREYVPPSGAKRSGAEGPVAAAFSDRHVYVYGTGGSPTAGMLQRRRDEALKAAEWASRRTPLLLSLRVLSDNEVEGSDFRDANLILFGTKETNGVIARFSDQLPMELNPSAADYSLVYIFPEGRRYVVINSGLPWWTGAAYAHRATLGGMLAPFAVAESFEDFILFKGSLENVLAEGRFDNNWRLPAADAAKMTATGAVSINSRP